MRAEFTVLGEPVGKGRPRATATGRMYTPSKTVVYENLIRMEYERQCGEQRIRKPDWVALTIGAYYAIPKNVSKKKRQEMLNGDVRPTKKPDIDNVLKCVADALNEVAYDDDTQIVQCYCEKYYSDEPRINVIVRSFE